MGNLLGVFGFQERERVRKNSQFWFIRGRFSTGMSCWGLKGMIRITDTIVIDESEIQEDFIRASGPGGQNVNKVATAVRLRFDAGRSPSLPPDVLRRLAVLAGSRMTDEGVLIIHARQFRTQDQKPSGCHGPADQSNP